MVEFAHSWLVIASAALAFGAVGLYGWKRRWMPALFTLSAALLFLAGARPQISAPGESVRHALVVDVSDSMDARAVGVESYVNELADGVRLPGGHSFVRFELSDALRTPGQPKGSRADYARLGDLLGDGDINGEVLLVTDGRGSIDDLYGAVDPRRLILLRPPPPDYPDASITSIQAPATVGTGEPVVIQATLICDQDTNVPWRMVEGDVEIARGVKSLRSGVAGAISHAFVTTEDGLTRIRLALALEGDREPRNDEASVAFVTGGKRVIAYCTPEGVEPQDDGLLLRLLGDDRNDVRVRHTLPVRDDELAEVGLVVINNLSLAQAGQVLEQTKALANWVNDGGNLMMVGARNAFGPGGYRDSPLEAVMPVRFRPEDANPGKVLLLLDTSASMGASTGGGRTRLDALKDAARRVIDAMTPRDLIGVAGFRQGFNETSLTFRSPDDAGVLQSIASMRADGSTHIATTLRQGIAALGQAQQSRILFVTDGEDVEGATQASYAEIASRLSDAGIRLDVVLTNPTRREWPGWIVEDVSGPDTHLWQVGDEGFEGLTETLDRALAGSDRKWIVTEPMRVNGAIASVPVLVRTTLRTDVSVTLELSAHRLHEPDSPYPVLARRQLGGRTVALTTESWGDAPLRDFWQDAAFTTELDDSLSFLLQNANARLFTLTVRADGVGELVWIGQSAPPETDLQTNVGEAVLTWQGQWRLEPWARTNELRISLDGRLLQRLPVPERVDNELRATGNDNEFFEMAQSNGVRVYTGLSAWRARGFGNSPEEPVDISWLAAALALLLLLVGFAVRS